MFQMESFLSKACVISPFPPKKTMSIERDPLREMSELQEKILQGRSWLFISDWGSSSDFELTSVIAVAVR